jgi:hypothetical protein
MRRMIKMSWSTLLTGAVEFKKGKTYDEVKEAIHYFCKYSGVNEPNIIEQYNDYLKNLHNTTKGAHIVISNDTIKLIIQDIDWLSDRNDDTINILKLIVAKYKDLISDVAFSLYYLEEENAGFKYDFYSDEDPIDDLITDLITDVVKWKYFKNKYYFDELVKDGIIDEKIAMLYKLKENKEEDD